MTKSRKVNRPRRPLWMSAFNFKQFLEHEGFTRAGVYTGLFNGYRRGDNLVKISHDLNNQVIIINDTTYPMSDLTALVNAVKSLP